MSDTFTDSDGTVRLRGTFESGQQASVLLTAPELLACFDTPIELVSAPGAGRVIVPLSAVYVYLAGSTPYTDNGGGLTLLAGGSQLTGQFNQGTAGFWDEATDQLGVPLAGGISNDLSFYEDANVMVGQYSANPDDGDGQVLVSVTYRVVTL